MNITGELRNVRRVAKGEDPRAPCLRGEIYNDANGRFRDGTLVTTSTVLEELEGGLFQTRNSLYHVASWSE